MRIPAAMLTAFVMILAASPTRAADDPPATDGHARVFATLAATYGVLNGLDVYTTAVIVRSGVGVEANPVLGPVASNTAALTTMRAATTAATVYAARHIWKEHPRRAIALLVVMNVTTGIIVAHNAAVLAR